MNDKMLIALACLLLSGCNKPHQSQDWPTSLVVAADGFPTKDSPCRTLGESAATSNYLSDSSTLVGCQNPADAAKLGGTIVATFEGITFVSVPNTPSN
jgi:hypothetical protein